MSFPAVPAERRRTKLAATVAVDSCDEAAVTELLGAGANLLRLDANAHDLEAVRAAYETVRAAAHNARNPIGIIADFGGAAPERAQVEVLAELGVDFLAVDPEVVPLDGIRPWLGLDRPTILARVSSIGSAEAALSSADGVLADLTDEHGAVPEAAHVARLTAIAAEHGKPSLVVANVHDAAPVIDASPDGVLVTTPSPDGMVTDVTAVDQVAHRREADRERPVRPVDDALVGSALQRAENAGARAIVVLPASRSGRTARALSVARPPVPVIGLALTLPAMLQQSILWGVVPRWVRPDELNDELVATVATQLRLGEPGDRVVTIEGLGDGEPAARPTVDVVTL